MKLAQYDLVVNAGALANLERTFAAYGEMHAILDTIEPAHRSDTFELQRLAYERIRAETGLPSRLVTNGIREYASGVWSADRLPLDDKLMSFKGVDRVSLATVEGRVVVGFIMTGYGDLPEKGSLSHLIRAAGGFSLTVPLSKSMQTREVEVMHTESISTRVSRLAAGLVTTVIEGLEAKAPGAVAEQAIREIDKAASDLKEGLASVLAERKRYEMQRTELLSESDRLDADIRTAMSGGREDLARAGIGRQDDIEAQVASLQKLIADAQVRIDEASAALSAAAASRRDAEERVRIAKRAAEANFPAKGVASAVRRPSPQDRIAAALGAVERLTDLPGGAPRGDDLAELEAFGRQRRIDDRLAALRNELEKKEEP